MKRPTPKLARTARKPSNLLESVTYASGPLRVDRDKGIIYNVKLLGNESVNGGTYKDSAKQDVARLAEGAKAYMDHPDRKTPGVTRSVREWVGTYRGTHVEPDGVYANEFHVFKSDPNSEKILEAAERFPDKFGLSINGRAAHDLVYDKTGKHDVHGVSSLRSVDVVDDPATTGGLFESVQERVAMKTVRTSVRQIMENMILKLKKYKAGPRVLFEMDGGDAALMTSPVDLAVGDGETGEDEPDPDDQIDEAFEQMVCAVMANTSLDVDAKIEQITSILKLQDEMVTGKTDSAPSGDPTPPSGGSGGGTPPSKGNPVKENKDPVLDAIAGVRSLVESNNATNVAHQRRTDARFALMESNIEPTAERVEALSKVTDAGHAKLLMDSWPKRQGGAGDVKKPNSGSVFDLLESRAGGGVDGEALPTGENFAKALVAK